MLLTNRHLTKTSPPPQFSRPRERYCVIAWGFIREGAESEAAATVWLRRCASPTRRNESAWTTPILSKISQVVKHYSYCLRYCVAVRYIESCVIGFRRRYKYSGRKEWVFLPLIAKRSRKIQLTVPMRARVQGSKACFPISNGALCNEHVLGSGPK